MRRSVSAILICFVALSWAAGLSARRELPPCCKAHGCTMLKQVTHGCAFSRCDQDENTIAASNVVHAIVSRADAIEPNEEAFTFSAQRSSPPAYAPPRIIDPPPEPLFA